MEPIEQQIIRIASQKPEEETCGLVLKDGTVVEAPNIAGDRRSEFEMGAEFIARYEEQIKAVWHSHPGVSAIFSPADVRACKELGVPWILYHVPTGAFRYANPVPNRDYIGRDWVYGLNDCFGLVTNWLKLEMGFDFPDVHRYHDKPEPSLKILEEFPPLMEAAGLERVYRELRRGDVLFMQINSPLPNHCAVVIDVAQNRILHHLQDRLSETDYYGSYWRKVTHSVWRIK